VYTPVVWKIHVPSKIHILLWLLAKNKILTRDNLAKKREVDDRSCMFCMESESVDHLFFKCCVACCIWEDVAEIMGIAVIRDFESLTKWWIRGDNYNAVNVLHAAVLWTLWKKRNNVCFQGDRWRSVQEVLGSCARIVKNWMMVNREGDAAKLDGWARELELRCGRPARLL
jgi:hypothetical protein